MQDNREKKKGEPSALRVVIKVKGGQVKEA